MIQIGDVILSEDIFNEYFCCDLEKCKGECCIEGDAGAPVTLEEVAELEAALETVWPDLSAQAQAVIDKQGVAYTDEEGDLVTSIVGGKDCVFTYYDDLTLELPDNTGSTDNAESNTEGKDKPATKKVCIKNCCLCATEKAFRAGKIDFCKPISCALYPIREIKLYDGLVGLNYHQWSVCKCGRDKGRELKMPVWRFLKEPLIRRFGEEWYGWVEEAAKLMKTPAQ